MVSTSGPLLLAFRIRAHYEIKVLLTLFQIFHKDHPYLKVKVSRSICLFFGKGKIQFDNFLKVC